MTRISDTVRTHLQRCRTLGEGLLKLCAHQSPYTGRTHRLFPPPQAASVRPSFEPTATPPSRATSRGCYRYANPPPCFVRIIMRTFSSSREIFSFRKICVTTPWQPVRTHVLRPYSMLMKHVYVLFLGFIESTWPTQRFLVCPVFVGFSRRELSKEFGERLFTPLLRHTEKTLHFL